MRRHAGKVALALALLALGFTLCRRGIVLSDEGYLLLQSYDLLHGKVLYRDLDSFVAPGVWFLLAGLFSVVEPSVLITRGLALACYLAVALVSYRIVQREAGERYAAAAVVAYGVFSVWAFPAWTFSFYSPYAVLFALIALERLLAWDDRQRRLDLLAVGVAVGLSILFKQNYGAFAALAVALGTLFICLGNEAGGVLRAVGRTIRAGLWILAGTLVTLAPAVAYFAHHDALGDAYQSLFIAPFTEFATRHGITYMPISELWRNTLLVGTNRLTYAAYPMSNDMGYSLTLAPGKLDLIGLLHALAYWLPPFLLGMGAWLAAVRSRTGQRDARLGALVAMAGGIFLGVFPRADYTHLMHVYQPLLPLAAVVTAKASSHFRTERPIASVGVKAGALVLLALFGFVAADWCRELVRTHSARVIHRRGGVLLSPLDSDMLNYEIGALQAETAPGEAVLTMPALSMLNFLADRPVPGKYYNLYGVHIAHDEGRGVVEAAEREHVTWVVAHHYNFFSDAGVMSEFAPRLIDYVRRTFKIDRTVATDTHMFMKRRAAPLPISSPVDLRASCDVSRSAVGDRAVLSHLLWDGLYHMHGRDRVRGTSRRDTLCTVAVPEDGTLYFMLDYRPPAEIEQPSHIEVRVWAIDAAEVRSGRMVLPDDLDNGRIAPRLALEPTLAIADGWGSPAPSEHALDLSDLGGRDALVVLRTSFDGALRSIPFDYRGFGLEWHDLRLGGPELRAAVLRESEHH